MPAASECPFGPTSEDIIAAVTEHGSLTKAAVSLGYSDFWLRRQLKKDPSLAASVKAIRENRDYHGRDKTGADHSASVTATDDGVVITYPTTNPALGDVGALIKECGLDPEDWVVVSVTLNKWQGMTAPQTDESGEKRNQIVPLNQWKVTLKRAPHLILAAPAVHVPPVKRKPRAVSTEKPELIVVEGDHQIPYHSELLHTASLYALEELAKKHNLTEHVFLGDTCDFPSISKYADHPAAMADVMSCIQGGYDLLRAKAEAAPDARRRKLKGNHDWRVESELLVRAERMYGIRPASTDGQEEIPALDLRRLLHLDKLGIELVTDPRGWEHAEVELVPGMAGLVVRHGWVTGANTAEKSLAARGRSIIVGHTHKRSHHFDFDPSAGVEREAVVCGSMCAVRGERDFPHFHPCDRWLQGFVTVTRWPSGDFQIEHARWNGKTLRWRDKAWS